MTDSELVALLERVSNWGRWGKDDQRGTLNLLTLEKRQRAIRLATTGESVSMSLPLATTAAPDNPNAGVPLDDRYGIRLAAQRTSGQFRLSRDSNPWPGYYASGRSLPYVLARKDV